MRLRYYSHFHSHYCFTRLFFIFWNIQADFSLFISQTLCVRRLKHASTCATSRLRACWCPHMCRHTRHRCGQNHITHKASKRLVKSCLTCRNPIFGQIYSHVVHTKEHDPPVQREGGRGWTVDYIIGHSCKAVVCTEMKGNELMSGEVSLFTEFTSCA